MLNTALTKIGCRNLHAEAHTKLTLKNSELSSMRSWLLSATFRMQTAMSLLLAAFDPTALQDVSALAIEAGEALAAGQTDLADVKAFVLVQAAIFAAGNL